MVIHGFWNIIITFENTTELYFIYSFSLYQFYVAFQWDVHCAVYELIWHFLLAHIFYGESKFIWQKNTFPKFWFTKFIWEISISFNHMNGWTSCKWTTILMFCSGSVLVLLLRTCIRLVSEWLSFSLVWRLNHNSRVPMPL